MREHALPLTCPLVLHIPPFPSILSHLISPPPPFDLILHPFAFIILCSMVPYYAFMIIPLLCGHSGIINLSLDQHHLLHNQESLTSFSAQSVSACLHMVTPGISIALIRVSVLPLDSDILWLDSCMSTSLEECHAACNNIKLC